MIQKKADIIEASAIRCVVDHDPETYSWPEDQKIQLIAHRFCSGKAEKEIPEIGNFWETHRQSFMVTCEASFIDSAWNAKR